MQYTEDFELYMEAGGGHEFNKKVACIFLEEVIKRLLGYEIRTVQVGDDP